MPSDASQDLFVAGQRLRKKLAVALALSSLIPLLVLAWVIRSVVLPGLPAGEPLLSGGMQALIAFTALGIIAGGYIIWDVGRTVSRIAEMLASERAITGLGRRKDEVGTLMTSFNRMLETIEQQAGEINSFATRLDAAYKELESTNARLKETSFKDEVTGLYNRRFFSLRLEEELSRYRRFNHPVSVVLLDLDGFKAVNDRHGHQGGDVLLARSAAAWRAGLRPTDLMARVGGDEFAILLPGCDAAGAGDVVQRMLAGAVDGPACSVGLAEWDRRESASGLLRVADRALYGAKRRPRHANAAA